MTDETLRVKETLDKFGIEYQLREVDESSHTAAQAATELGCQESQIAKSIVFTAKDSKKSILVIASGINRVNTKTISEHVGEKVLLATPEFVYENSGFKVGGVSPVAHLLEPITFIDEELFNYDEIWAAAGTPKTVFSIFPDQLAQITGGKTISIL